MSMTREEALKIWLPVIKTGVESMQECNEALDMAIKALEQEPCEDCISRQAAIDAIRKDIMGGLNYEGILTRLPPVTPQPKTGHWIYKRYGGYEEQGNYHCSECGNVDNRTPLYCPHCGAKMIESEEEDAKSDP